MNRWICAGAKNSVPHQSNLTAQLIDAITGQPLLQAGVTIAFSTTKGTLSDASANTDGDGKATTTLTSSGQASELPVLFQATITAQVGANSASTNVEFQPTILSLSATPHEILLTETASLSTMATWNGQPIAQHGLGWRISRIWDAENNLVYDGTGSLPSGYGTILPGASTETDVSGQGTAVYKPDSKAGVVELESSDQSVAFVNTAAHPTGTDQAVMKKVVIKRKKDGEATYKLISKENKNEDVLPGELIDLTVEPAGTEWSWTLPGVTFKDYSNGDNKPPDVDKAILTKLAAADKTSQMVKFYWTDTGEGQEVMCAVKINDATENAVAKLNVKKPKVSLETARGTVRISPDNFLGLFGDQAKGATNGIDFNKVNVAMPLVKPDAFPEGEWQFVQITNKQRFRTLNDDTVQKYALNDQWVLDVDNEIKYPYLGPFVTDTLHDASDSPSTQLKDDTKKKWIDNELFKMYIMFRPGPKDSKSKWVPVQMIAWNFSGSATRQGDKWTLDAGSGQSNEGPAVDSKIHPEWTRNALSPALDPEWIKK